MKSYFRYLTNDQAMRYLYLASYDLLLAIRLVHHDRGLPLPPSLLHDDGGNGKIKIALRNATLKVRHPAPDNLVQTMTAKYPSHLLSPIMDKLMGSDLQLTTHDVRRIEDLLKTCLCLPPHMDLLCCCCGGCRSNVTENHAQQLQYISDMTFNTPAMEVNLSKCIVVKCSSAQVKYDDDDSPPCEHILSINMCLLDAIHCFYIRALAALPLPAMGTGDDDSTMCRSRLLQAFVVSGHCYGPLDPVSNIIVNTVWYNIACPHLSSDQDNDEVELTQDIFDTDDISCLVSDSLCGLVALIRAINGAPLSKHDAMEYLWFRQCDLTLELQQTVMTTKKNPYDAAVKASKQYTLLGKFLKSFSGKKLDSLRCMMESIHDDSPCVISNANWEKLNTMIKEQLCLVLGTRKTLHGPQDFVAIRDSAYASQQMFIRNKIEQLLDMYSRQHSWELRYKLDLVCGVEGLKSNYRRCYHANFLASAVLHPGDDRKTALPTPVRTRELFFAVFWESQPDRLNSKPICCPIQDCNASVGRCSFCGEESKIFHPPCAFGSRPNHGDAANTIPDYNVNAVTHIWK
uniref:Uncharacterized protein n=1 Tax=Leersia perrieri TaxID=77586 RepID=A0A0D9XYL3_9ORYZ